MTINWDNLALAVVSSVLAFLSAMYFTHKKNQTNLELAKKEMRDASEARMREMELRIAVMGQQVLPFWTAAQAILTKQLSHYHTPRGDVLLGKLGPPFMLSAEEERELYVLLDERTRDMGTEIDTSEREAAAMLPLIISRVRQELVVRPRDMEMRLVMIPRSEAG